MVEKFNSTDISGNYADWAKSLGGFGLRVTEPSQIVPAIKAGVEATLVGAYRVLGGYVPGLWMFAALGFLVSYLLSAA